MPLPSGGPLLSEFYGILTKFRGVLSKSDCRGTVTAQQIEQLQRNL